MIRAGELRHRVTIQQNNSTSRDAVGAEVPNWQDVATVWAAVEPLRGREYLESQQVNAEVDTRIRIRHYPGITPDMRVIWGSRIYEIEAVINVDERDREIHLMCRERVD